MITSFSRRLMLAAAAMLVGAPAAAAAPACPLPSPAAQARASRVVDAVVGAAIAGRTFPGAVVGLSERGCITLVRGYGLADVENRVPVTAGTSFRIGSMTKQFFAVALLRLADQGKLSLDDRLAKFLPDFPRAGEVTLRQLLNHTAGIATYLAPEDYVRVARADWTVDRLVARIAGLGKVYDFDPGTAWRYSNSGYVLIGAVVEKVTGQPYDAFLKSELLSPLGLASIAVDDPADILFDRAHGYDRSKEAPTGFRNADYVSITAAGPAGALRATAPDILKWSAALFGGAILKPASLAELTKVSRLTDGRPTSQGHLAPTWAPPGSEYGLGLFLGTLAGHRMIGHGGAINGFNAWFEDFPDDKVTIVLLTNANFDGAEKTGPAIAEAYLKARAAAAR